MTLMVLDYVALFPTYDPATYPLPTNVELSRVIYTNPVGTSGTEFNTWYLTYRYRANFKDLEREARRTPSLTTWLNRIQIFSGTILPINANPIGVWYGNINDYTYTHGGFMSRSDGRTQGTPMIINTSNNDIFRLNLRAASASGRLGDNESTFGISQSQFINVNGENLTYRSSQPYPSAQITVTFPGRYVQEGNANDYSHRLADVINLTGGLRQTNRGYSSLLAHGWTHTSLNRQNRIELNRITQIPAVKAFDISDTGPGRVIAGPGSTGGDLVLLPNHARLKIRLTPASTGQIYRVRVRYASTSTGRVQAQRWSPSSVVSSDFTYNSTGSLNTFGYVETLSNTFNQPGVEIIIQNLSSTDFVVDKVEFIPVGTLASQSLEETQGCNNNYNQRSDTLYNQGYDTYDPNRENTY